MMVDSLLQEAFGCSSIALGGLPGAAVLLNGSLGVIGMKFYPTNPPSFQVRDGTAMLRAYRMTTE